MPFRNSWPPYHHDPSSSYYHQMNQSPYYPNEPTYQELHSYHHQNPNPVEEPPLPEPWLNSKDDEVLSPSPEISDQKDDSCVGCGTSQVIRVHYGANSCHGCKAFFRRTVFDGRVYVCSGEKKCEVKNEARNRCRACRFQNCLKGGMNPRLVRDERSEASSSKRQDSEKSTSSSPAPAKPQLQESPLTLFVVALEKETELLQDKNSIASDFGSWSRDVCLESGLQNPNMVIKRLPLLYTCDRIMDASDLYLSWYRSFVFCADWALGIPEFRALSLNDQTALFKQNFMAFGWITLAYKCFQKKLENVGIPLGNGAFIPYDEVEQKKLPKRWAVTYGVVCKKLIDLIVKVMIELQISEEEYCLIKTISLFQQGCLLSESSAKGCSDIRNRLLDALSTHIELNFPKWTSSQQLIRAVRISMLLPSFSHIGQVESTLIQQLTAADLHQLSGVPMEICDAQKCG